MINKRHAAFALAGLMACSVAAPAPAAQNGEAQEQAGLQGTRLTLSQAIAMAEQQTGGKAYDAGVDVEHGALRAVVKTNGPKGVQTVIIDAQSGQVVSSNAGSEED